MSAFVVLIGLFLDDNSFSLVLDQVITAFKIRVLVENHGRSSLNIFGEFCNFAT